MKKFVFVFSFLLLVGFAKAADSGLERLLKNISDPESTSFRKENERLKAEIAFKDQELAKKNYIFQQCSTVYMQLLNYTTQAKAYIERFLIVQQEKDAEIRRLNEELQAKNQQITNQNAEMQAYRTAHQIYVGMISKYRWNMAKTALFSSLATYGCIQLFNWFS